MQDAPPPRVQYLDGVENEFALRLAGLSDDEALPEDSSMRHALISGDADFMIAATLFQRGEFYTMDMIVLNRGDEPVQLQREDLRIVDREGRWLRSVEDWNGAERYGLRGKAMRPSSRFVYDAPEPARPSAAYGLPSRPGGEKGSSAPPRVGSSRTRPVSAGTWRADFEPVAPSTPQQIEVAGDQGKAFWAYFEADEVAFPLTAFVMLDGRHMMFQFDR